MCAGAIVNARIRNVYIGTMDEKTGACGSVLNLLQEYPFNHKPEIETGILQKELCPTITASHSPVAIRAINFLRLFF